jgi:uncharacterized peroxidase-related enzyme
VAYIAVPPDLPGIVGLLALRRRTAAPLVELVNALLQEDGSLNRADRELIATHVSRLNDCEFCARSHGAVAALAAGVDPTELDELLESAANALVDARLAALLDLAALVQRGGHAVTASDVQRAREAGATDGDVHDTILIAAAFCMFNRYVDGLGTEAPDDQRAYAAIASRLLDTGYAVPAAPDRRDR